MAYITSASVGCRNSSRSAPEKSARPTTTTSTATMAATTSTTTGGQYAGCSQLASRRVQVGGTRVPLTVRASSGLPAGAVDRCLLAADLLDEPERCQPLLDQVLEAGRGQGAAVGGTDQLGDLLGRSGRLDVDEVRCSSSLSWSNWSSHRRTR